MLPILKHPMGCAVILLVPGAQRTVEQPFLGNGSGYHAQRFVRAATAGIAFLCLSACFLSPCWEGGRAWPGHFSIFPGKCHLPLFLVSGTLGDPGDHLPCFQAAKFKMHLCVEISVVSLLFTRLCLIVLIVRSMFGEKPSTTKEGTLESLSLNTFCRWWGRGRGKCFALGSAQLSSSSLTPLSVAPLKLPASPCLSLSSKPCHSLMP